MSYRQNKQAKMQPNVEAEGDSSINTKKGFLISFPNKKKNEGASGIVPAKTVNSQNDRKNVQNQPLKAPSNSQKTQNAQHAPNPQGNTENKERQNNKRAGFNDRNRQMSEKFQRKPVEKISAVEEAKNEQIEKANKENRDNFKKHNQKNKARHNGSAVKEERFSGNPTADNQGVENIETVGVGENIRQKGKNNQQENRNRKEQNALNKNKGKNQKNRQSSGKGDRRDNREAREIRDNRDNRRDKKFSGLSPLSADMLSFSKSDSVTDAEKTGRIKEPSLEEKYKNAPSLAVQIARDEAKRASAMKKLHKMGGVDEVQSAKDGTVLENDTENAENTSSSGECEIVGIRFREAGKIYYFDPDGNKIPYGTPVIVETSRGSEYGYTAISNRFIPLESVVSPLKKIKRVANDTDTEKYRANKALEAEAAEVFKEKTKLLKLEMNLVFVEYTFDNSKLLFYFTADGRVDFRELVKELAQIFRTRIELRQIGVRDEAKLLGGLGVCGRSVCCNSFLGDFAQVSIKMAKDQGLSLNSAKISGACGKLMCCLRFEDGVYSEETARTPKVGTIVETSEGKGTVTEAMPLKGQIKVTLDATPEAPAKIFGRDDVKVIGFNKNAVKDNDEDLSLLAELEDNK